MARPTSTDPGDKVGLLLSTIRQVELWWRLLWDPRVSPLTKLIPFVAALYVLFPFDLVMDPILGLGQLDDLAILVIGMELFVRMSPGNVVDEIWRDIRSGGRKPQQRPAPADGNTVDATCRVVDDEAWQERRAGEVARTGGE